jgi:DNA-binding PadR family transcriptional regulator
LRKDVDALAFPACTIYHKRMPIAIDSRGVSHRFDQMGQWSYTYTHTYCVDIPHVSIGGSMTSHIDATVSPDPLLLGFLMLGPRHPYELHQEICRELGRVWHIGQSHLYACLKQLAEDGLLTVQTEAQSKHPARNIYAITPAGRVVFLDWLHQPAQHGRTIRLEFLARLYLFRRLSIPGLEQLVAAQKTLFLSRVASLDQQIAGTPDAYWRLVLEFRQGELKAIIDWLDRCLSMDQLASS